MDDRNALSAIKCTQILGLEKLQEKPWHIWYFYMYSLFHAFLTLFSVHRVLPQSQLLVHIAIARPTTATVNILSSR